MIYEILVKQTDSGFIAAIFGLPDCTVEAASCEEAIAKAKIKAQAWTATGEFVEIHRDGVIKVCDLPGAKERGIGIFADVPEEEWNEFLAAMKEYRDQIDADPNIP